MHRVFGAAIALTLTVACLTAEWSVPRAIRPGGAFEVTLSVRGTEGPAKTDIEPYACAGLPPGWTVARAEATGIRDDGSAWEAKVARATDLEDRLLDDRVAWHCFAAPPARWRAGDLRLQVRSSAKEAEGERALWWREGLRGSLGPGDDRVWRSEHEISRQKDKSGATATLAREAGDPGFDAGYDPAAGGADAWGAWAESVSARLTACGGDATCALGHRRLLLGFAGAVSEQVERGAWHPAIGDAIEAGGVALLAAGRPEDATRLAEAGEAACRAGGERPRKVMGEEMGLDVGISYTCASARILRLRAVRATGSVSLVEDLCTVGRNVPIGERDVARLKAACAE